MNQKYSEEPVTSGQSYKNKAALLLSNTSSACKRDIALLKQLFEVEEGPGLPIVRFRLDCSHQDIWPMPRRVSDLDPS